MGSTSNEYRDLLQQKLELFLQMLQLTEKQCINITDEEELDQLEKLIRLKQKVIEKVDKMNATLAPMEEMLCGVQKTQEINDMIHQIEEVAQRIHQLETNNIERFTTAMEEVKKELDVVRTGKKVTENYYVKPVQEGGYFINRRR